MRNACAIGLLLLLLAGCDDTEATRPGQTPRKTAAKPAAKRVVAPPPPQVAADAFPDIPTAVAALAQRSADKDLVGWREASDWLALQGPPAVAPLQTVVDDSQSDIRAQINAIYALSQIGPPAAPALLQILSSHPTKKVRLNAIDKVALIDPSSAAIVKALVGLLDHQDDEFRRTAVNALGVIGEPAGASADRLVAILNNPKENDSLRGAAKVALKKVNPRHTFLD
ncbi:HEAT repeat domain-containing protein [Lignipirellula cremea]|uniref:HEAT repeat protein n=1 Tax=Lignipirellula cremea TaxID=2528010 RepID=A0A518E269_9BACT|nr:HEAT repeat domain-containing protein [Lignipirellula cremea]QDU98196.1 hypothetical protein Pla8534_60570 [Lignipirellula cremea]